MSCHLYRSTYNYYPQAPDEKQRTTRKTKTKPQKQEEEEEQQQQTQMRGRRTHTKSNLVK